MMSLTHNGKAQQKKQEGDDNPASDLLVLHSALGTLFLVASLSSQTEGVAAFASHHQRHRPVQPRTSHLFFSALSESVPTDFGQDDDEQHHNANNGKVDLDKDFQEFLQQTRVLSEARNLKLDNVLNARDLATCKHSPIQPGKLFRTGRLSDASDADIELFIRTLGLNTLVDLRSATELKEDPTLMRAEVFGNFTSVVWKDRGRTKDGCIRILKANEYPIKQERFWQRSRKNVEQWVEDMILGKADLAETVNDDDCDECERLGALRASQIQYKGQRKERVFVPLMNEFKYVNGTLSKLRKRDIIRAVLKAPGSIFSRRVRKAIKKPFLKEINGGGLQMLNELLFRYGAPGIRYVLELCADEKRHPIAFYCTAGKDRTGAIAAIILALYGVEIDDIVEDYSLSHNVYFDLDDGNAMVGALSQRDLDPQVFLGAPPQVMKETLQEIQHQYGSVEAYCNWIGFGPEEQRKLREVLTKN